MKNRREAFPVREGKVLKKPTIKDRPHNNAPKIAMKTKLLFSFKKPIVGDRPMVVQSASKHGRRTFLYSAVTELVCNGQFWARADLRQLCSYKVG